MIARVLKPEEWPLVEDLAISQLLPFVRPEDVRVIVVEAEGQIIASMTVMRMTHIEGTWVDPQHRNAGTIRALMRLAEETAAEWSSNGWVLTSPANDTVRAIVERMNGRKMPLDSYALAFGKGN